MKKRSLIFILPIIALFALVMNSCSGYKVRDGKVYYESWNEASGSHTYCLEGANAETFESLDDGYGKDDVHAWYCGELIKGANGASFRTLGEYYATDGRDVWRSGEKMRVADAASFKVISYYFSEDKVDYYWNCQRLYVADKSSFKLMGSENDFSTQWAKDKKFVYYLYSPFSPGDTTENGEIRQRIKIADYDSFHTLEDQDGEAEDYDFMRSANYAADKYQVYYCDTIVPGADPATFKVIDFITGQDKNCVYWRNKPTQIKDFKSLKQIGGYYKDDKNVYDDQFEVISGIDVKSFTHIEYNWYKDKNHLYFLDEIVADADPATFESVPLYSYDGTKVDKTSNSFDYVKDANHVFYHDSLLVGADPKTFFIVECRDAESWTVFDKNTFYEGCETKMIKEFKKKMKVN